MQFGFKLAILLIIFCNYSPDIIIAQGEFNNWYFGNGAGITFNSGSPSVLTNCAGSFFSINCPSVVSDSLGGLLFYSDHYNVYNRNHVIMMNGSGLESTDMVQQPCFIVQSMMDDSLYYLFTMDSYYDPIGNPNPKGLCYSLVDLSLDGGLGGIASGQKNIQVPGAEQTTMALTATRHKNNRETWIIVRKFINSNEFLSYKVSSSGINLTPVVSYSLFTLNYSIGQGTILRAIKVSPDGSKLICMYDTIAELCNFNTETGAITPLFLFSYPPAYGGNERAEFSLNARCLYIGKEYSNVSDIYQYDLSITDSTGFVQSAVFIGQTEEYSGLQLGPDGKIYFTVAGVDSIGVINHPEVRGVGCDFQRHILGLNGNISWYGFPQFLQRYYVYPHSTGHCEDIPVIFSATIWPPADSAYWNFGDPASGAANISNELNPSHVYITAGSYNVMLIIRHNDKRFDTAWLTVEIHETPLPLLGPDQTICQGDTITLDAGACSGCTYEWVSIPPGFSSTEQTVTLNQSGIYTVAVTSINGCTGRDTMQLSLTIPPVVTNSPLSTSICSGESTGIPLTSNMPNATFSWTAIGSSPLVTGFSPGSGDTIDQVLTNRGSIPETVTYWITPAISNCIGDSVPYLVTVTPGDSVNISISASVDSICDGTPVTYNATTINGGTTPSFQWKVDGLNQGTNDSIFTYIPINGDTITCVLTSSNTSCTANNPAASNAISVTVNPNLPVSISISAIANPVCEGEAAIFTVSTANKGNLPVFQWFVNGFPVGTNDSTYNYIPSSGDQIYCILTSSEQCTTNNPATSETINMVVSRLLPVGITITPSANPICGGIPVTFTATSTNGGNMPGYQWQVNGFNVGGNNPNYTYLPADGDVVSCILTSNQDCITGNPAISNTITMQIGEQPVVSFAACFDTITTLNAKPYKLKGGIPLGGIYSGPGVDQLTGYFNPAMAGIGLITISYSYTNVFNCSDNATKTITVISPAPFSCGDSLTDIRDNKKYSTVQIGSQCWLAQNLNHGQQIGGSLAQRDNCLVEKYCYNDLSVNCTQYGALYQWDELMRYEDT